MSIIPKVLMCECADGILHFIQLVMMWLTALGSRIVVVLPVGLGGSQWVCRQGVCFLGHGEDESMLFMNRYLWCIAKGIEQNEKETCGKSQADPFILPRNGRRLGWLSVWGRSSVEVALNENKEILLDVVIQRTQKLLQHMSEGHNFCICQLLREIGSAPFLWEALG